MYVFIFPFIRSAQEMLRQHREFCLIMKTPTTVSQRRRQNICDKLRPQIFVNPQINFPIELRQFHPRVLPPTRLPPIPRFTQPLLRPRLQPQLRLQEDGSNSQNELPLGEDIHIQENLRVRDEGHQAVSNIMDCDNNLPLPSTADAKNISSCNSVNACASHSNPTLQSLVQTTISEIHVARMRNSETRSPAENFDFMQQKLQEIGDLHAMGEGPDFLNSTPIDLSVVCNPGFEDFPPACVSYAQSNSVITVSSGDRSSNQFTMFDRSESYYSLSSSGEPANSPNENPAKRKLEFKASSYHHSFQNENIDLPPPPLKKSARDRFHISRPKRSRSLPIELDIFPEDDQLQNTSIDFEVDISAHLENPPTIDIESDPGTYHRCISPRKKRPRLKYVKLRFLPFRQRKKPDRFDPGDFKTSLTPKKGSSSKKKRGKMSHNFSHEFDDDPRKMFFYPHLKDKEIQ